MNLFSQNSNGSFGLDISNLTLKLCEVQSKGIKNSLQALSRADLPKGVIEGGEILKPDEFVKAIKKMIAEPIFGKVTARNVVASLPEEKTFIKLIEVGRNPNSLKEIISAEIEKNIPVPMDEMYLDWQVITDAADKKVILVGAAPKRVVDKYVEMLSLAGLSVQALEIESVATCRALLAEESIANSVAKESYLIVDIGGQGTDIIAYAQGVILFSVSVPISSDKVTEKIAETLKIDFDQAEKAKVLCGLNDDKAEGIVKDIVAALTDQLIRKITEIVRFQSHHYENFGAVSKIILSGGGSNIEHLDQLIAKATNLPVVMGDIFTNLNGSEMQWTEILKKSNSLIKFPELSANASSSSNNYATAVGLALREKLLKKTK
jgi:type IV pilus assembly protein PilM